MALRFSGKTYPPVFEFDPRKVQNAFRVTARNKLGQYTSAQGSVLRANRRALAYMQRTAAKNLDVAIKEHGRPQTYNSGKLRAAILSDEFSRATVDGFDFLIDELLEPAVPYYRAIESGSNYWVKSNRKLVLDFIGGGTGRDAIIGPRQRGFHVDKKTGYGQHGDTLTLAVNIRRPVPAYHYGTKAMETFKTAGIYKRYVKAALAEDGLELT